MEQQNARLLDPGPGSRVGKSLSAGSQCALIRGEQLRQFFCRRGGKMRRPRTLLHRTRDGGGSKKKKSWESFNG